MSGCSSCDAAAVYQVILERRAQDMQRLAGQSAARLIDAAQIQQVDRGPRPLPPDATISIRA